MARANKCDICGTLYEGNPGRQRVNWAGKVHVVMLTGRTDREQIDMCPQCCIQGAEFLIESIKKEKTKCQNTIGTLRPKSAE